MTLGEIVYSKAGRDSGEAFIIIGIQDDHYIFLADGDIRRIEKAKKKKRKHVIETGFVDQALKKRLLEGNIVSNADIRKGISSYMCQHSVGGA